jgi:hypothetical protein
VKAPTPILRPEAVAHLRARFARALAEIHDGSGTPAGLIPACRFDYADGVRFIVSRELEAGAVHVHLSASIFPDTDAWRLVRTIGGALGTKVARGWFLGMVPERFRSLADFRGPIPFVALTEGEVAHWKIPERDWIRGRR